jgi:Domain of unknown function (DUF397)
MDRLTWRKASYSGSGGGNCVEVADVPGAILVRDTKDAGKGTVLRVPAGAWTSFLAKITQE